MNLSPSAVFLIIVVVAMANILIMLTVSARSRAGRARQLVEVDALLAPPSRDDRTWESGPENRDPWLPASDGWPTAGAFGAAGARRVEPVDPEIAPFEFPAPTPLERRYQQQDDAGDGDETDETEDDDDMNDDDIERTDEDRFQSDEDDEPQEDESEALQAVSPIPIGRSSGPHGRDALTGLMDATAFEEAMSHEEAREQRYGHPATVIVFELDGLAKLVDRLGSDPGDRIETALGDTIMRLARRADYVARLERGRYAVLLPETDEVAAINYVERIRRACDLWLESGAIAMRLAIGWASTTGDAGLSGAIRVATERMRVELRRNSRQAGDEDDVTEDAVGL